MADDTTFNDRMFMASEAVYEQIVQGQCPDVEAALMDAQLDVSDDS